MQRRNHADHPQANEGGQISCDHRTVVWSCTVRRLRPEGTFKAQRRTASGQWVAESHVSLQADPAAANERITITKDAGGDEGARVGIESLDSTKEPPHIDVWFRQGMNNSMLGNLQTLRRHAVVRATFSGDRPEVRIPPKSVSGRLRPPEDSEITDGGLLVADGGFRSLHHPTRMPGPRWSLQNAPMLGLAIAIAAPPPGAPEEGPAVALRQWAQPSVGAANDPPPPGTTITRTGGQVQGPEGTEEPRK